MLLTNMVLNFSRQLWFVGFLRCWQGFPSRCSKLGPKLGILKLGHLCELGEWSLKKGLRKFQNRNLAFRCKAVPHNAGGLSPTSLRNRKHLFPMPQMKDFVQYLFGLSLWFRFRFASLCIGVSTNNCTERSVFEWFRDIFFRTVLEHMFPNGLEETGLPSDFGTYYSELFSNVFFWIASRHILPNGAEPDSDTEIAFNICTSRIQTDDRLV